MYSEDENLDSPLLEKQNRNFVFSQKKTVSSY